MRDPGAPVELYRLLEAADEPELIDRELPEDAEILELGAGSGRITRPLIALGRTFGGVLLMSNLINQSDIQERLSLLRAIQRHLEPNGVALIERYDPEAGEDPTPTEHERYGITIRSFDIHREGKLLYQKIEY